MSDKRVVKSRFERFIQFPIDFHKHVTAPNDYKVFFALSIYANWETGECFPSYDEVCTKFGMSRPTFSSSIKSLEKKGYLRVEKRPGFSTIYWVGPRKVVETKAETVVEVVKEVNTTSKESLQGEEDLFTTPVKNLYTNLEVNKLDVNNILKEGNEASEKDAEKIFDKYSVARGTRTGKKEAIAKIKRAVKKFGFEILWEKLEPILYVYSLWIPEKKQFIPQASTFFNQERFQDDVSAFMINLPEGKEKDIREALYGGLRGNQVEGLEMNEDKRVMRLLSMVKLHEGNQGLDLGDQFAHKVVELKGGLDTFRKENHIEKDLLDTYKFAVEKNMRAAFVKGNISGMPKKL